MDKMENQHLGFDYNRYGLGSNPEFKSKTDSTGYWFAAAVLFAFLAAGVIIYRAGDDEFRTAANDAPAHPQISRINPTPLLKPQ